MQKTQIDVLIADGIQTRIGMTVLKSLRRKGLVCEAIDDSEFIKHEGNYMKLLLQKLSTCEPKVIFPIFRSEALSRHRDELPEDAVIACGPWQTTALLDNKVSASELCSSLGIPQPALYKDEGIGAIPAYPVVFKREFGLSGSAVYFPKSEEALLKLVNASGKKPHLIMDFIDGNDICVDAIRWKGYFHAEAYKVILPKMKGISIVRKSIDAPELIGYVKTILESVDYNGVCGVDFREEKNTGRRYFLECNPRFSGGLRSSIGAGFDIPYILWQLVCGETPGKVHSRKRLSIDWKDLMQYLAKQIRKG